MFVKYIIHSSAVITRFKINQMLYSQKAPHTSPWRASYGVSFVDIFEKIDRVITAPHCTFKYEIDSSKAFDIFE